MNFTEDESLWMARALELAARGEGRVEPNPMVGCVLVRAGQVVGEGWHARFGEAHAEAAALQAAGERASGATAFVTLEPCCHHGKTPPCAEALIAAGVTRVVCAQEDPFPQVSGGGIAALRAAGIAVECGLLEADAARLNSPYLKLTRSKMPWVIAKWAMTLDGKIATHTGDSQWISCEESRALVHELRGRIDAILIGGGTARRDNPLLTARPTGLRTALRIVLDSKGQLSNESQLLQTAREVPILVVTGGEARDKELARFEAAGAQVFVSSADTLAERLRQVLEELGRRRLTNLLVEGGSRVLGALHDARLIDEVWAFIAPKLIGGFLANGPLAGQGSAEIAQSVEFAEKSWRAVGSDLLFRGRVGRGMQNAE